MWIGHPIIHLIIHLIIHPRPSGLLLFFSTPSLVWFSSLFSFPHHPWYGFLYFFVANPLSPQPREVEFAHSYLSIFSFSHQLWCVPHFSFSTPSLYSSSFNHSSSSTLGDESQPIVKHIVRGVEVTGLGCVFPTGLGSIFLLSHTIFSFSHTILGVMLILVLRHRGQSGVDRSPHRSP